MRKEAMESLLNRNWDKICDTNWMIRQPTGRKKYPVPSERLNSRSLEMVNTPRERILHELEPLMIADGWNESTIATFRNREDLDLNTLPAWVDLIVNGEDGTPVNSLWRMI